MFGGVAGWLGGCVWFGDIERPVTYRIAGAKLLLCRDDGSAALGCVELALASNDCLSGCAAAAGFAADLGDGVPVVRHCELLVMNVGIKRETRFDCCLVVRM